MSLSFQNWATVSRIIIMISLLEKDASAQVEAAVQKNSRSDFDLYHLAGGRALSSWGRAFSSGGRAFCKGTSF